MYSLEEIRENYKYFSDSKIETIARNESKGLRKEVLVILKDEIIRRNLNLNLINWVETETKSFEGKELKNLVDKIQNQNCPKCSKKGKLYGFETNTIKSFLIGSNFSTKKMIVCKGCGKEAKWMAIGITFCAGWWSGLGLLNTPLTLLKDLANFLFIENISERTINDFIDDNTGYFRRHGIDDDVIIRLLK